MKRLSTCFALLATFFSGAALAAVIVGQPAPPFTLSDLTGKPVNLADYQGRTVVLEWHNFGCPFVQKHYRSGNMQSLQKRYAGEVVWLAVNSTHPTSSDFTPPGRLATQLRDFGAAPTKYLMDERGTVGMAYGARTTPQMFVIDARGTVVYSGAIDDKRSTDVEDVKSAKNYVVAALEELKAGKPISTPSTAPYGCSVKYR